MGDVVEGLSVDLLNWVATGEKGCEEVMEAWRTSCPKLPVWEDANDCGFVTTEEVNGRSMVAITPLGRAFLEQHKRRRAARIPVAWLVSEQALPFEQMPQSFSAYYNY